MSQYINKLSRDEFSDEVSYYQAKYENELVRVAELEKDCDELAKDRLNWKHLANTRAGELNEANRKLRKENAELKKTNSFQAGVEHAIDVFCDHDYDRAIYLLRNKE